MMDLGELHILLDKQIELQEMLYELEIKKTDTLAKGNIEELDHLVNLEQPMIMSSANIERKRDALQEKMGIAGMTLREILQSNEGKLDPSLEEKYEKLSMLIVNLKRVNVTNQKILESRMKTIDYIMQKMGLMSEENLTYQNKAKIKKSKSAISY